MSGVMESGTMANNPADAASPRRGRLVLVLIFAFFALPLVVAWVMNFAGDWVPQASANHGTLIQPVRPVELQGLVGLDGEAFDPARLADDWTLVYLHRGACDETCYNTLYKLRQVRLAQGKNIERVQRLLLLAEPVTPDWAREARGHYPGMQIARPRQQGAAALTPFPAAGRVYLIDPLGQLMMEYPLQAEPAGMIEDLERLLRISYVG
ncbi:hypothetical protein TspCOW1_26860 [Thiohalobacter sp. COW1]|nr:hypothetical protein TspCOW1_26860 [Thiohalobacter sp. COW1]